MGAVCCLEKKTRKTKRSKEKENEKLVENYLGLPPIIHIMREKAEIQKKMKAERLGSKTPRGRRLEVREEPRCRSGSFNPLTQEETEDFTFRKTSTLAPKKFQRDSVIHLFKRNFDIKDQVIHIYIAKY